MVDATLAVRTHVQVDGALAGSSGVVEDRTRELIERHPALTTDLRAARDAGLSVLALDAVTSCSVTEEGGRLEVECGARYSVADERGKLLSTWERSVELSGPLDDSREALLRIAVSHALEGLPARVLSTCSSFECTEHPSVANADW